MMQFVLWRDVLEQHSKAPLHAMVGGGDQIYNDEVFSGHHMQEWLKSGRKVSHYFSQDGNTSDVFLKSVLFFCMGSVSSLGHPCLGLGTLSQKNLTPPPLSPNTPLREGWLRLFSWAP